MALFNEILSGRLNRAIQKFTGIKGSPPAPQLSSEFMPIFPFFWGAENRYLEGWNVYGFVSTIGPTAAVLNAIQLRNPVGSGVIGVIIKMMCTMRPTTDVADQYIVSLGPQTVDLTNLITIPANSCFDRRIGATSSAFIRSFVQSAGPATAPPDRATATLAAQTTYDFVNDGVQEFTLLPGDALNIRNQVVNQNSTYTIWWRERPLEDSEKF